MLVLISAFEPFGEFYTNSSLGALESVKRMRGSKIKKVVLPVVFKLAGNMLIRRMHVEEPDLIICLGQSADCEHITLEKYAHNKIIAEYPDNVGKIPKPKKCCSDGKDKYKSNINLDAVVQHVTAVPIDISKNAGTFVCNEVYYRVLHEINTKRLHTKCCFIHLPAKGIKKRDIAKVIKAIIKLNE